MNPIVILFLLLILVVVGWIAFWVVGQMGVPEPINMVLRVIIGVILLLVLLGMVSGYINVPYLRLR
ncbi:MAG: hypothetical protein RLZZ373_1081 [Pseudomonadota bacterium]